MVNPFTATGGSIKGGGGRTPEEPSKGGAAGKGVPAKGSVSFQEALKRGSAHAWKGQWAEAAEEYRRALKQSPRDVSARTYLAMALYKSGQFQEAQELYAELWKSEPSNLSLLQRLAEVQEARGDLESAVDSYRLLAEIHVRRRSPAEALKAWQKVVALKPGDPASWHALIEAAAQTGRMAEFMPRYLALARELAMGSRFEEAIAVVERSQILDPSNPSIPPLLASIRRALEYSWRAAAQGEETLPEELGLLIPALPGADSSPSQEPPPAAAPEAPAPSALSEDEAAGVEDVDTSLLAERLQPTDLGQGPSAAEAAPVAAEPEPMAVEAADLDVTPIVSTDLDADEQELSVESTPEGEPSPALLSVPEGEVPPSLDTGQETLVSPVAFEAVVGGPLSVEEEQSDLGMAQHGDVEDLAAAEEEGRAAEAEIPDSPALAGIGEAEPAGEEPPGVETVETVEGTGTDEEEMVSVEVEETAEESAAEVAADGTAIAEQVAELAEAHERLGEIEQAREAYAQALELSPHLPRALLGMARLQLAAGELELAEAGVRRLLESPTVEGGETEESAARLLLDILIGRAVGGDLESATEGLRWLRARVSSEGPLASVAESGVAAFQALVGRCGAEHLDELALLQPEVRGEVVLALRRSEELSESGQLRAAADDLYRLIGSHPEFLPAQSMLGQILVAQGRREEARKRSQRLLELYDMRGTPGQALEVLWWRVAEGISDGDERARLVELLKAQNRFAEAEAVEAGKLKGWAARRAEEGEDSGLRTEDSGLSTQNSELRTQNPEFGAQPWEALLGLAEARLGGGDREGALNLVREALGTEGSIDDVPRAALLRVLQQMGDAGRQQELAEILGRLGLPEELAE